MEPLEDQNYHQEEGVPPHANGVNGGGLPTSDRGGGVARHSHGHMLAANMAGASPDKAGNGIAVRARMITENGVDRSRYSR